MKFLIKLALSGMAISYVGAMYFLCKDDMPRMKKCLTYMTGSGLLFLLLIIWSA